MQLDYHEGDFILTCEHRDARRVARESGLLISGPASTSARAVLYTREPYAVVRYAESATPVCKERLGPILTRIEASRAYDSQRHLTVPLGKELWGFQKASVAYCLDSQNALIGDVPGLGKTPSAVVVANEIQSERCLVICPATIRQQWANRIREWTTQKKPLIDVITRSSQGISLQANWIVISYELARNPEILAALAKGSFDLLILDEAHYAKSGDSKRGRAIFGYHTGADDRLSPLVERAQKIVALTGTPLPNRPAECYALTRGLAWDAVDWMSEERFKERFNPTSKRKMRGGRWITYDRHEGYVHELQARLRANFMVRHTKDEEVRRQIGSTGYPVYDLVHASETGAVRQALAAEKLLDFDVERMAGRDAKFDGQVMTVRRQMGVALAPQAAGYVRMLLEGGEDKIVVFGWHIEVLDILSKELDSFGVLRVDGSTSPAKRDLAVRSFQNDPRKRIFLGNSLSAGTGLDGLQHVAHRAVQTEPDWTPSNNQQPFDRLDRGGQKNQVQCDMFVAPGSILEGILAKALRKLGTITRSLD